VSKTEAPFQTNSSDLTAEKDQFYRHMQRAGLKRTAQRDLIVDVFLRTEDHLSSEDLYHLVKAQDPTIGQTTIYRTLKLLTEAGLASEVRLGDGRTRYEPNNKFPHHDHMICTGCGRTVEFFSAEIKRLLDGIAAEHEYEPKQHSLRIFGVCADCRRERNERAEIESSVETHVHLDYARAAK
jgi:Fur family ferric uptake transcriptional regulator